MLSDHTIRQLLTAGQLAVEPTPDDCCFQPASIDLRLGADFLRIMQEGTWPVALDENEQIGIDPRESVLATTAETLTLPDYLVARVEGKSTWGRKFLMVHSTAGFIDPGFCGQITLELHNLSPRRLYLRAGEPIAQVSFERLDHAAARPYGHPDLRSRYQHQSGATAARDKPVSLPPLDSLLLPVKPC